MVKKEKGVIYSVGEFQCPHCGRHCVIYCNPNARTHKHLVK